MKLTINYFSNSYVLSILTFCYRHLRIVGNKCIRIRRNFSFGLCTNHSKKAVWQYSHLDINDGGGTIDGTLAGDKCRVCI